MTPEEKAEKWYEDNLPIFEAADVCLRDFIKAYLAGYAEGHKIGYKKGYAEADNYSSRDDVGAALNKFVNIKVR